VVKRLPTKQKITGSIPVTDFFAFSKLALPWEMMLLSMGHLDGFATIAKKLLSMLFIQRFKKGDVNLWHVGKVLL
jgi:hypothetical protein